MAYGHVEDFKLFYAIFKNCYNQFYNLKILNLQNSITHCPGRNSALGNISIQKFGFQKFLSLLFLRSLIFIIDEQGIMLCLYSVI